MYKGLTEFSRNTKKALLVAIDITALPVALWAGYALRLGELWPRSIENVWWLLLQLRLLLYLYLFEWGCIVRYCAMWEARL